MFYLEQFFPKKRAVFSEETAKNRMAVLRGGGAPGDKNQYSLF